MDVVTDDATAVYQLTDIVEVTRFIHAAPTFRFIGKEDNTVDLFGEKLNEAFVGSCLTEVFSRHNIKPAFYMVAVRLRMPRQMDTTAVFLKLFLEASRICLSQHCFLVRAMIYLNFFPNGK